VTGSYVDQTITPLTSSFVQFKFGGVAHTIFLFDDEASGSTKWIAFSWNGLDVAGMLHAHEFLTLDDVNAGSIFLKYVNNAPAYRLFTVGS